MFTMHTLCLLAAVLLSAVAPVGSRPAPQGDHARRPSPTTPAASSLTLPTTGTGSELPAASGPLQYATIARGTQNYTCSGDGAAPVQIGAHAYLYDVTPYARDPRLQQHVWDAPRRAVYLPLARVEQFTDARFGYIGYHDFVTTTTPAFNLNGVGKKIYAQRGASVPAPADAARGPDQTAAVAWVQLVQSTAYTTQQSVGLSQVYRVETAGGSAWPVCNATNYDHQTGLMLVDYATLYYFV